MSLTQQPDERVNLFLICVLKTKANSVKRFFTTGH